MKKVLAILTFIPVLALGQSPDQNYIKTTTYKDQHYGNPQVQVSYLDGLGRPIQQVSHQQSNSGKDIVTHIEYDAFGRQVKEFLPYANQSASLNYNSGANSDIIGFYNQPVYENTLNPFSEKKLEASPLDRVLRQAAPGTPWALHPTGGTDKSIKIEYLANTANEVQKYSANAIWNAGKKLYEANGIIEGNFYLPNTLYKTITKDENWTILGGKNNTVEEFKDKDGRVVLKRTYNAGVSHDTYYVYDQFGNLSYVIPPLVNTQNTISPQVLDGLCYQYKYDNRNRLVEKKIPGKQWEFIVYDKMNRVVATGPTLNPWSSGEQGWIITKYDAFSRVVYTGWFNGQLSTSSNRKTLQDLQNTATVLNESKGTGVTIDNIQVNYTNTVYPTSGYKLLTVNYYDDYNFPGAPENIPSSVLDGAQPVYYNATVKPKGLPTGSWERILSLDTETLGKTSYSLYDNKGRVVRSFTGDDYYRGYTQTDSKIDFSGKTLITQTRHKRSDTDIELVVKDIFQYTAQDRLSIHKQQIGQLPEQLIVKNSYDELGQLRSKNVGGQDISGATALQKIDYNYNIRGWLTGINNEQGGDLPGIQFGPADLFGFKINYNKLEGEPISNVKSLYNGNIAETLWMASSDNVLRKYSYQYDNLNRLLQGTYQKPSSETSLLHSYNEELNYDKNGNIQYLNRNGDRDTDSETIGSLTIDKLTFTYNPDSPNQLIKVFDESALPQGFKDDSDGITDDDADFVYDSYGNMTEDTNKNIKEIYYNHLNLPTKIQFTNSNFIEYIYTATGTKFQKKVRDFLSSGSAITDYSNGFQYKDERLQFFPHAEGYVNVTQGGFNGTTMFYNYVFNYTDHLGNIRLSYGIDPSTKTLKIIEENHYYPFGLKHTNYNSDKLEFAEEEEEYGVITLITEPITSVPSYKYKYNGKEWQDELGLNVYDYGAMMYDPATGRRNNIDQKAEQMRRYSPYSYCFNNPMRFTDPDGMSPSDVIITGDKAKEAFKQLQSSTSLKLKMDGNGKVTASGKAKTGADEKLLEATTDTNVVVQLNATSSNYTQDGAPIIGGAFEGNEIGADGKTYTSQSVNPEMAEKIDKVNEAANGTLVLHEVLESFIGGKESPGIGKGSVTTSDVENNTPQGAAYTNAHNKAGALDGRFAEPNVIEDNTGIYITKFPYNPSIPKSINPETLINNLQK